jgi:hypothetical protein
MIAEIGARQILALPFYYDASISVSLMDMPGFDDTKLSDRSVLEELTAFLKPSYDNNIQLSGIIYLHLITDAGKPGSQRFLMIGNHTGEGPHPLDTFLICLTYKVKHPQKAFLLPGPLETRREGSLR